MYLAADDQDGNGLQFRLNFHVVSACLQKIGINGCGLFSLSGKIKVISSFICSKIMLYMDSVAFHSCQDSLNQISVRSLSAFHLKMSLILLKMNLNYFTRQVRNGLLI